MGTPAPRHQAEVSIGNELTFERLPLPGHLAAMDTGWGTQLPATCDRELAEDTGLLFPEACCSPRGSWSPPNPLKAPVPHPGPTSPQPGWGTRRRRCLTSSVTLTSLRCQPWGPRKRTPKPPSSDARPQGPRPRAHHFTLGVPTTPSSPSGPPRTHARWRDTLGRRAHSKAKSWEPGPRIETFAQFP